MLIGNAQWLHYLVLKLLQSKRLRPPSASRKSVVSSSAGCSERECYECLKEVEDVLGQCLASVKAHQAPRKRAPGDPARRKHR